MRSPEYGQYPTTMPCWLKHCGYDLEQAKSLSDRSNAEWMANNPAWIARIRATLPEGANDREVLIAVGEHFPAGGTAADMPAALDALEAAAIAKAA